MDELGNGRTNPVCFRDFDIPQTEFPEKSDLIESVFPNFLVLLDLIGPFY